MKVNKFVKIFIVLAILVNIQISVIAASTGIVNSDTVRVREKPTTNSEIIELVSIGDKINITGEEGDWYQVKIRNIVGYIRKDLLTVNGENTSIPTNGEPEIPSGNDSTGTSNTEKPNEEVPNEIVSSGTEIKENDTTMSTIKISGTATVNKKVTIMEETKIKILPLVNSTNIVTLEANTEVTILEVINKWCRVEAGENIGWVRIDQ